MVGTFGLPVDPEAPIEPGFASAYGVYARHQENEPEKEEQRAFPGRVLADADVKDDKWEKRPPAPAIRAGMRQVWFRPLRHRRQDQGCLPRPAPQPTPESGTPRQKPRRAGSARRSEESFSYPQKKKTNFLSFSHKFE